MTSRHWDDSQEHIRQFLVERARYRSLVLFVGAGVSQAKDVGLPGWRELVAPLASQVGADAKTDDPLDIAQWFTVEYGRNKLLAHVRGEIGKVQKPGKLHRALAGIGTSVLFTTNYDQLLEGAIADAQGVPPDAIIQDGHVGLLDESRRTTVVKLHGCLSLPETIVLARDEYELYAENHRAMIAYLQSLLATRTFLFVGTSLNDPSFRVVHSAIRRALGRHQRQAYLLDAGPKKTAHVRDWAARGVSMLHFPTYDIEQEFIEAIGDDASGGRSILDVAKVLAREIPPPSIEPEWLIGGLRELESTLETIVDRAIGQGLISEEREAAMETSPSDDDTNQEERRLRREKILAILNLAQSIDRLAPLSRPNLWVDLGDMLYVLGDSTGAIQAYNNALRPYEGRHPIEAERLMRIRGNLGRAYARDGHYERAEWLLRQCVFKSDRQLPDDQITRHNIFARLNPDHLAERPTDASELTYALSRRAERLREGGHVTEAFEVLNEARYLLEPLLGVSKDSKLNHDLFSTGYAAGPVHRQWDRRASSYPRAYAFSFLGKCYRLSCSLALDEHRAYAEVLYFLKRAVRYLRTASTIDPKLPYPWAHRLQLHGETRLPINDRNRILEEIRVDLKRSMLETGNVALVEGLISRAAVTPQADHVLREIREPSVGSS